jgi:hypothetical protein
MVLEDAQMCPSCGVVWLGDEIPFNGRSWIDLDIPKTDLPMCKELPHNLDMATLNPLLGQRKPKSMCVSSAKTSRIGRSAPTPTWV